MSYDLHGTWDQGNQWTGAFLDAHTNLTEIKTSLDLLWRNDIPPEQVVLGLAFYGRAFRVPDPSCTKPGCIFSSGADAGECSDEVGILMISEIADIIEKNSLKPTLDKEAAVKMITWDNQWVAYDDGDTLKLKADFARSQCLGGLMVWAVSHDQQNGTLSQALGVAAKRKFVALSAHIDTDDTITTKNDQCKWMNCGVDCPAGWVLLRRSDKLKRGEEWMLDDGGCIFKEQFHRLCCPPGQEAPTCGWYNFNNGDCNGKCPDGTFEIGGTNRGCSTVKGNYQAACCTTGKKSTALYEKCQWGDSFNCKAYTCPAAKSDLLVSSCNGNGGSACAGDWRTNINEERKYCCNSSNDEMKFNDCTWEDNYSSTGYQVIPAKGDGNNGYCFSNCPDDKVRVAMERDNTCKRKTGSRAQCCSPNYTTTKKVVDPLVILWENDLKAWLERPRCDTGYGYDFNNFDSFTKRSYTGGASMSNLPRYMGLTSSGSSIERRQGPQVFQSNYAFIVLTDIIYAYRSTTMMARAVEEVASWNKIIGAKFTHLTTTELIPFLKNVVEQLYSAVADELASRIICNLDYWDRLIEASTLKGSIDLTCENVDRDSWDPEYLVNPDTYGTSSPFQQKRGFALEKRVGASREFTVDCGIDPITGLRRIMIIESRPYPNGESGDALERANGLTVRFALAQPGDCTDTTIDPNAPNNIWVWVSKCFVSNRNVLFLCFANKTIEL